MVEFSTNSFLFQFVTDNFKFLCHLFQQHFCIIVLHSWVAAGNPIANIACQEFGVKGARNPQVYPSQISIGEK